MGDEILIDEEELSRLDKKLSKKLSKKLNYRIREQMKSKTRCRIYLKIMDININNITDSQREDIMDYYGLTYKELNELL